jgi:hypothetical protein
MRLTDSAVEAILQVMIKKDLDPSKTFLEIGVFDGAMGLGFTNETFGKRKNFGKLGVIISHKIDTTGVVIDFGEIKGRKGLIFLGEDNVNHSNGEGDTRNQKSNG